ncbi:toll/interleukin-1 receptor domain-containing protein [Nocardioides alcanivorans]|uniref:toll/interleukin-1 receptor domain-containing protein n=1 Tax=Nocardioides alcanivorans TaxID=2897352 RepID=UPI001F2C37AB|nr:toll/interleukin-1 receptor domain-containing protein [Nocardioides alcanivorans]
MSDPKELKVFLSWSGDLAKQVASELRGLIPTVFDLVRPWMSDHDIAAGSRGLANIASELDDTRFGIIVVTRDNQSSQWLNFEAGALSKKFGGDEMTHVVPLLVDMDSVAELTGPLTQFQAKVLNRDGLGELLKALGTAVGVSPEVVDRRLSAEWEEFLGRVSFAKSRQQQPSRQSKRSTDDMIEEILELVRQKHASTLPESEREAERFHKAMNRLTHDLKNSFPNHDINTRFSWIDGRPTCLIKGPDSLHGHEAISLFEQRISENYNNVQVLLNGEEWLPF